VDKKRVPAGHPRRADHPGDTTRMINISARVGANGSSRIITGCDGPERGDADGGVHGYSLAGAGRHQPGSERVTFSDLSAALTKR